MRAFTATIVLLITLATGPLSAGETPAPEGAEVYFIAPEDGATVSNPVRIVFGLRGMGVAPAGIAKEKTGHHHLLVNTPMLSGEDLDYAIPADDNHLHFGGGQTEASIDLAPGTHTLQLLVGDQNHIPHDPPIHSDALTITVE
ncbi:DUF4399 domain-containing protein [Parvibaculaceae bacterium PLY_AMNH_Bact1]|nr:DUF4399 domain-containing protein [Parvibaculaceae bacterium PLY_AMNH_Bact1]